MSRLSEMIKELCPDGVEYKKLGEIGTLIRGKRFVKNDFIEVGVPAIHYGELYTHYGISASEVKTHIRPEIALKMRYAQPNDIVIVGAGETIEDIGIGVAWLGKRAVAVHDACYIFHHELNPVFISYILRTEDYHRQLKKYITTGKISSISANGIGQAIIPVPPLSIQNEIVKLLDNYTALTAELTEKLSAELVLRKKQYNFYRDSLLNFVRVDDTIVQTDRQTDRQTALRIGKIGLPKQSVAVEWRTLGEVAKIVRGASPRPIQKFISKSSDAVAWVKIGDAGISAKYIFKTAEKITPEGAQKSRKVGLGDLILSNSMSFGRPYLMKIEGYIHDGWLAITEYDKTYQSDFLYYLLSSGPVQDEMKKRASFGGAVQNLNLDIVKDLYLPIPSLETQAKIVSILDRFDALCNDLTQGLPAEIVARKKQYEYYRDKLLTFRRKGA